MPRRIVALLTALALAGCVQGSAEPSASSEADVAPPPSTTTTLGRLGIEQATLEFGSCMRSQGIDTPEIRLDAQGRPILDELRSAVETSSTEFRSALTQCAPILTGAGALDLRGDPELQAMIVSQLRSFSDCARSEGLDTFPDPDPGFSGIGSPFPSEEVPFSDPAFAEVVVRCQELLGAVVLDQ